MYHIYISSITSIQFLNLNWLGISIKRKSLITTKYRQCVIRFFIIFFYSKLVTKKDELKE